MGRCAAYAKIPTNALSTWNTCAVIKEIFAKLARLDRININNPAEIIFAFPHAQMCTRCLAVII
jgi:hypothetical protein